MIDKTILYWLTFSGLYLELVGAFLLAAEAIGQSNLLRVAEFMRNRRILSFSLLVVATLIIILLSQVFPILSLTEAIVLILTFGIFLDFAPNFFEIIINRLEKGTAGILGFIIFSIGFIIQAYVNLLLLR